MKKVISILILVAFCVTNVLSPSVAQEVFLPPAQEMIALTPAYAPALLKGVKFDGSDPFRFEFIVDKGDAERSNVKSQTTNERNDAGFISSDVQRLTSDEEFQQESTRLIKYFLATLTTPEKDLWVNLSPFESGRIIQDEFGRTAMGRDLLAQDYILKQITSSLMHPDSDLGQAFWKDVYKKTYDKYGTTDIPVDTFNKVWIVPEKAVIYENLESDGRKVAAYVDEARLKVMLEMDYLAMSHSALPTRGHVPAGAVSPSQLPSDSGLSAEATEGSSDSQALAQSVIREIILPALEKEVNEGKNFAPLRQIYHSLLLAVWLKKKLKTANVHASEEGASKGNILSMIFVDQNKTAGVDIANPKGQISGIYDRYVEAFQKGVYNLIREDKDLYSEELIPRKYFSGGFSLADAWKQTIVHPSSVLKIWTLATLTSVSVLLNVSSVYAATPVQPMPKLQVGLANPGKITAPVNVRQQSLTNHIEIASVGLRAVITRINNIDNMPKNWKLFTYSEILGKMGLSEAEYGQVMRDIYEDTDAWQYFTFDEFIRVVSTMIYLESTFDHNAEWKGMVGLLGAVQSIHGYNMKDPENNLRTVLNDDVRIKLTGSLKQIGDIITSLHSLPVEQRNIVLNGNRLTDTGEIMIFALFHRWGQGRHISEYNVIIRQVIDGIVKGQEPLIKVPKYVWEVMLFSGSMPIVGPIDLKGNPMASNTTLEVGAAGNATGSMNLDAPAGIGKQVMVQKVALSLRSVVSSEDLVKLFGPRYTQKQVNNAIGWIYEMLYPNQRENPSSYKRIFAKATGREPYYPTKDIDTAKFLREGVLFALDPKAGDKAQAEEGLSDRAENSDAAAVELNQAVFSQAFDRLKRVPKVILERRDDFINNPDIEMFIRKASEWISPHIQGSVERKLEHIINYLAAPGFKVMDVEKQKIIKDGFDVNNAKYGLYGPAVWATINYGSEDVDAQRTIYMTFKGTVIDKPWVITQLRFKLIEKFVREHSALFEGCSEDEAIGFLFDWVMNMHGVDGVRNSDIDPHHFVILNRKAISVPLYQGKDTEVSNVGDNVGGIDLATDTLDMIMKGAGGDLNIELTPDQVQMLQQNIPGFVPVIIDVRPLESVPAFLGMNDGGGGTTAG